MASDAAQLLADALNAVEDRNMTVIRDEDGFSICHRGRSKGWVLADRVVQDDDGRWSVADK
jgi:hypothetical protein